MYPPSQTLTLDIDAISGILGSISIACWVVVFSPQIIENFQRSSADGLSVVFIVVWLAGDVFNILGAVLQGVLPTMIILAVYYTLADIVLLGQLFYYRGFTLSDAVASKPPESRSPEDGPTERSALIHNGNSHHSNGQSPPSRPPRLGDIDRRSSWSSFRERLMSLDGTHLSPANPLIPDAEPAARTQTQRQALWRAALFNASAALFNASAVVLVCFAGILGWWLGQKPSSHYDGGDDIPEHTGASALHFSVWGQIFGYICAVLYLGSRIPQLLLNYRRKSTEGISMLFFLFACIGNLTYVLSIFAYKPICEDPGHCRRGEESQIYAKYVAVNFSWILGSFGTLGLDAGVFVQYFLYLKDEADSSDEDTAVAVS